MDAHSNRDFIALQFWKDTTVQSVFMDGSTNESFQMQVRFSWDLAFAILYPLYYQ